MVKSTKIPYVPSQPSSNFPVKWLVFNWRPVEIGVSPIFFYLSCHLDGGQDSLEVEFLMRVRQIFADCWLPLALLLGVYTISLLLGEIIKELTLAPLLSLLSLFILAMFRTPGFVLIWTLPFLLLSYYLISPYSQFVWTRTLTLLLGAIITAYASFLRTRAVKLSTSLEKLFSRITHPIIVSDVTSKILFFNQAACDALEIPESELRGFSWFNLILDRGAKARDIERYVRLGISERLGGKEVFYLVGLNGKIWEGTVIKEGAHKDSRLITTLNLFAGGGVFQGVGKGPGAAAASTSPREFPPLFR